nr:MAG TPA: MB E2F transcription factor CC-MB domain [Caudoviricetes sp.]
MGKEQLERELAGLHEKERSLEKALELVREKIRELVNYTDKNKG